MRLLAVATLLTMTLCGCAARSSQLAGPPAPSRLPLLPELGAVAGIPPSHGVSATFATYNFEGWPALQYTPGVGFPGDDAELLTPAGALYWVLYDAHNAGCPALSLNVELSFTSGEAWVMLADYDSGTWEPHGPYSANPPPLDLSAAKYYSPSGHQYFCVVGFDGTNALVESYAVTIAMPDAESRFVETGIGSCDSLDLIELDGRPAIVYYNDTTGEVIFAHATTPTPSAGADWVSSRVAALGLSDSISAAVYDGKPVVAYYRGGITYLVASSVAEPAGVFDWTFHALEAGTGFCHLAVIDGRLTAAYYEGDLGDDDEDGELGYMRLAYPATGDPAGDWASYRLHPSDHLNSQPWLGEREGMPTVAWAMIESGAIAYGAADDAQPVTDTQWAFHELSANAGERHVRLLTQRDRSYLAFSGPGTIELWEAWQPVPVDESGWNAYSYAEVAHNEFDFIDMGGTGVSAFVRNIDASSDELVLRRELEPLGRQPWLRGLSVESSTGSTAYEYPDISLAMVAGQPAVAAAYSSDGGSILYAACSFD